MAKIISPVWSTIRGSIAGTTYLTTPSGQIVGRQRTKPTQPVSQYRTAIRNAFTEAVADWAALGAPERTDWNLWAGAYTGRSGRHEFIAAKAFLRYGNELPVLDTPVIVGNDRAPLYGSGPTFSMSVGARSSPGTGVGVTIKNQGIMECWFMIEISPAFGLTRSYWKGPWNMLLTAGKAVDAAGQETVDITVGAAGQRVFVRVRGVSNDSGAGLTGHTVTAAMISSGTVTTVV